MRYLIAITLLFYGASNAAIGQAQLSEMAVMLSGHTAGEFKEAVRYLSESEGVQVTHKQDPVIRFSYDTEANRVAALELLYSRTYHVTTKDGMPATYPILPSTPTAEEVEAFNAQKLEWIESNPELYESMQQPNGIIVIPQEEFDQMPTEKQQVILDNPDLYSVE